MRKLHGPMFYIAGPPAMVTGLRKNAVASGVETTSEPRNLRATKKAAEVEVINMLVNRPKTKILVDGGDPEETRRIRAY